MRIHEAVLRCADVESERAFLGGTLGLAVVDAVDGISARTGPSRLTLQAAPGVDVPPHHVAWNVPEDAVPAAARWLAERAPVLEAGSGPVVPFPDWNAHAVYFADPAGNVLELIGRHDLVDGRGGDGEADGFDAGDFLAVSEVGIPSDDPPRTVAFLESVGLPVWRGDRERFTAVGGQDGLLIVVPLRRPWFPTAVPAAAQPLLVRVEGPRDLDVELPGTGVRLVVEAPHADAP